MPINQRNSVFSQESNWRGTPLGIETPVWEFGFQNKLPGKNKDEILSGFLKKQTLGIIELLSLDTYCEVEVIFKININRNYIVLTSLDDGTNTKVQKETKIGLLLQYIKAELEN